MARSRPARHGHHNLPTQGRALVGRDQELARLCSRVLAAEGRLVTLTGVGGCGKTRLAVGVGPNLVGSFNDGVWFVPLAPLSDPLLVLQAVASVFGVREASDRSQLEGLVGYLARRQLLLVLDNCEHLVQTCAELADMLLQACPRLCLLATSREPLHISAEVAWRVPPLAVPELRSTNRPAELLRYPAVQLFVERATAVESDFALTPHSAPVVAAICRRLEGLPLAIELAAAWVRALGVEQILARLDDLPGLLVGGSRSSPSRQQTMLATLDWSYSLLALHEQAVFRRLAVFVGGWSLEAAEVVCARGEVELQNVLPLVTRLVDTSLVQVEQQDLQARYRLLEPVRQYAHEKLAVSGELDTVRRQHAAWFLSFAEQWEVDANVGGPRRQAAHAALEQEQDNLRAALRWCVEQGEVETGFCLGRAHWNLWVVRGLFTEGRGWLTQLALHPNAARAPDMRAVAQSICASLAYRQGNYTAALELYREALPVLRQKKDPWLLHNALADLGFIALQQGDYGIAEVHFDEALAIARAAGQRVDEAIELANLGILALVQEHYPTARAWFEESLPLSRSVGDTWTEASVLDHLGRVALRQGDLATARRLVEGSRVLRRHIRERFELAYSLDALGLVATAEGHHAEARAALREGLCLRQELGDRWGIAQSLESIAALAAAETQPQRALELAGLAAGIRENIGGQLTPMERAMLDHWLVPLRRVLGEDATTLAWEAGHATPVDQAVERGLAATDAPPTRANRQSSRPRQQVTVLSPREQEVAALLAHGLTNRQIAKQLVVTERTVAAHIEHILDKLGFASRHQVGAWAAERSLLS